MSDVSMVQKKLHYRIVILVVYQVHMMFLARVLELGLGSGLQEVPGPRFPITFEGGTFSAPARLGHENATPFEDLLPVPV